MQNSIKRLLKIAKVTTCINHLIKWLLYFMLKSLFATYRLRITYEDQKPIELDKQPGIFYFWHQSIITGMLFFRRAKHNGHCIVSPSNDGKIAGFICQKLGFKVLYSSSARTSIISLRKTLNVLEEKRQLCLIGDGSRGPAFTLQRGIINLAKKTNLPLVFIECKPKRAITLSSWDQFHIPLPFSIIDIHIHQPRYPDTEIAKG